MLIRISVENQSIPAFDTKDFATIDTEQGQANIENCRNYAALDAVNKVIRQNGGTARDGMWVATEIVEKGAVQI